MPFLVKLTRWFISVKVFINQLKVLIRSNTLSYKPFDQLIKFRGIGYWCFWPMKRKGWFNRKSFALFSVVSLRCLWELMAADQTMAQNQCTSLFFVALFFWISYEFLLHTELSYSVMGWFYYSHNDFMQGLCWICIPLKHKWAMSSVDA